MGRLLKRQVVQQILQNKDYKLQKAGRAFAPANIALCKYWGKRDQELNLPVTSSLSISLGKKGTITEIQVDKTLTKDEVFLNQERVLSATNFYQRLTKFLDLFRKENIFFRVKTYSNIPVSAGLASSASGFAALVKALDQLFSWGLTKDELSILARIGSGSASRSVWNGFVVWQKGEQAGGMDSLAYKIDDDWPEIMIGLLIVNKERKKISSTDAMQVTVDSCPYYALWPKQALRSLENLQQAIKAKDFKRLADAAEYNCLQMHALMQASYPPIVYGNAATISAMEKVWQLREKGLEVYFTQDAGPNLKLIFQRKDQLEIERHFVDVQVIDPWIEYSLDQQEVAPGSLFYD